MAAETAFHAEPWECKHVEHSRSSRRTMPHCARPTPILTPGDPLGWDGKRTWKKAPFHCRAVKSASCSRRERETTIFPSEPPCALARHAIIQITDSISLSVMCKCDLISTYPPSPSSPIYQDQLGAFFCLCDSCGANFFPAPAEKDKSRKKHSAMPYSSGGCSGGCSVGRAGTQRENVIDIRRLAARPDGAVFELEQCGQSGHSHFAWIKQRARQDTLRCTCP